MVQITTDGHIIKPADIKKHKDIFYVLAQLNDNRNWKTKENKQRLYLINITDDKGHNTQQIENTFNKLDDLVNSNSNRFKEIKIDTKNINKAFTRQTDYKGLTYFEQRFAQLRNKNRGQKGTDGQNPQGRASQRLSLIHI